MGYNINDVTMREELCALHDLIQKEREKLPSNISGVLFQHPLDDDVIGEKGLLTLMPIQNEEIDYSSAEHLDRLWRRLLEKAIMCLRFFDKREPFIDRKDTNIVAYGMDELAGYHDRYTDFESLMYGASSHYRDHVFHAVRVWLLGIFCMLNPMPRDDDDREDSEEDAPAFITKITLDGGAELDNPFNFFEKISMWTIISLCHDLGYPLEKADQILTKTRNMMRDFIPNPNIWNDFGYSGIQDNINEYILRFISTKMVLCKTPKEENEKKYYGRIQPKYYLKFAKSLEHFQHGIISSVIIFKILVYFLESDFNLNDDYRHSEEAARQFYIRREILRAIAAHTCPDAYNIHVTTFSSLLFLVDELQEWGRKSWNELYTGLTDSNVSLKLKSFAADGVEYEETITTKAVKDDIVIDNIIRVFKRQYVRYKSTFRDGQATAVKDFDLKKTMRFDFSTSKSKTKEIKVVFYLPTRNGTSAGESAQKKSYFCVLVNGFKANEKKEFKAKIENKIAPLLYGEDLTFDHPNA